MDIGFCSPLQRQTELIAGMEHFTDLWFPHWCINITELMVNNLYQTADSLLNPCRYISGIQPRNISIHIDGSFFQCFCQIQLGIFIALTHFCPLCFFNALILRKMSIRIFAQETFYFHICLHFPQELIIIGKKN